MYSYPRVTAGCIAAQAIEFYYPGILCAGIGLLGKNVATGYKAIIGGWDYIFKLVLTLIPM